MPVCTLVKPMRPNTGYDLGPLQHGEGRYWFQGLAAYHWYVLLHCRDGRPENDDVRITDPGPPVVVIGKPSI
jgi:hypothetical protein